MTDEQLNCIECGACCVSDYDAVDYVHMLHEEADAFEAEGHEEMVNQNTNRFGETMPSLKTAYDSRGNCRCIALRGTIGEQVNCSVYDLRPKVCRKFKAGSGACYMARRAVGLEFSDR